MTTLLTDSALVLSSLMLAACAAPPPAVHVPPVARTAAPVAPTVKDAALASSPTQSLYLPPERAGGSPYCLDPDSSALRDVRAHPSREDSDWLPAAALADDIRDLHQAMKHLYAGYPDLLQNPRFDVERFFADWESEVRSAGERISFRDGVTTRLVALRRVHGDAHLSAGGLDLSTHPDLAIFEFQAKGHVAEFDARTCDFGGVVPSAGTSRFARLLTRSGLEDITTFSAASAADSIDVRCAGVTTTFTRRRSSHTKSRRDAPPYQWHTSGNAAVIVIRRFFGSPEDEATLARIEKDYDEHRNRPIVVFDFRGNSGGNDAPIYAWLERAVRGPWQPPYVDLLTTAWATCGAWNHMVLWQIGYKRVDDAAARQERTAFWQTVDPAIGPVHSLDAAALVGKAKAPYTGRVLALVDHVSASSGETAPAALHNAIRATLVGERTMGVVEYGNVRPWLMPRTGIAWELASKRDFFDAPREGVGLPVDVYLGEDLIGAPADELVPMLARLPGTK